MRPLLLPRSNWGAVCPPARTVTLPAHEVWVHTSAGADEDKAPGFQPLPLDATLDTVRARMRSLERFHRDGRGWVHGVGYNFVAFPAVLGAPGGVVCEGRGWGRLGTHTAGHNDELGVCFYGHGDEAPATAEQWSAAIDLVRGGLRDGRIHPGYRVLGHRDDAPKSCPGALIYPHLDRLRGLDPADPPQEDDDMFTDDDRDLLKATFDQAQANGLALIVLGGKLDAIADAVHQIEQEVVSRNPNARTMRRLAERAKNDLDAIRDKLGIPRPPEQLT